ncbi:hypothetical protein [Kordiimonas sp.]|uniref:hypothetical protein n=1 Tax=Kordiimonas sp. TaxID=1970157 RepID=UPI003A955133
MALDATLAASVSAVLNDLPPVIDHIQQRKDYAKSTAAQKTVTTYNAYSLALKTLQSSQNPSATDYQALDDTTKEVVLPQTADLISANIAMANMGQLNTSRTIEPTYATEENKLLTKLLDDCQTLSSLLAAEYAGSNPPSPPPSDLPDPPPSPSEGANTDTPNFDIDSYQPETITVGDLDPYQLPGDTTIYVQDKN